MRFPEFRKRHGGTTHMCITTTESFLVATKVYVRTGVFEKVSFELQEYVWRFVRRAWFKAFSMNRLIEERTGMNDGVKRTNRSGVDVNLDYIQIVKHKIEEIFL